jgi:hypothetical protein
MFKKTKIFMLLVFTVLLIVGCDSENNTNENEANNTSDIVASVNEKDIYQEEFEKEVDRMKALYEQDGVDPEEFIAEIRDGVINSLINQEILTQEAIKRGFSVNEEEVLNEINMYKEQMGEDEFFEVLEINDLTEPEFIELLMNEYLIDEFLSSEVQNIEVTEEEMQEIYDFYKAQAEAGTEEGQEAEFPAFDEIRNELEQMVRSDKEQEYILNLIEELKADITIQIYI